MTRTKLEIQNYLFQCPIVFDFYLVFCSMVSRVFPMFRGFQCSLGQISVEGGPSHVSFKNQPVTRH